MILFFRKLSLNKLANNLFELKASDPPLKIEQFPDFKHNAATSAVTLGLLSYITPMTPIGVVTLLIVKLFGLRHVSKTLPTGSLNFAISFIECLIPSILFLFKISLSTKCFLLTFFTSFKFSLIILFEFFKRD